METDSLAMNNLWRRLSFAYAYVVSAVGSAGGLCLMWKQGVEFPLMIHKFGILPLHGWFGYFTYGPPYSPHRRSFWEIWLMILTIVQGFGPVW